MNFFKPKFWDKNKISFFSVLLFPASLLIKALSLLRRFVIKTHQSSIPIICVGNIYLGGTGKTPLCIEIFSILKNLNMNPAFIRKKYDTFQDEVNLQQQMGPVYQNKKRIEAVKEALRNTDLSISDLELFEINEAFAAVALASMRDLGVSEDIVNVNGGAIALGHPIGMSGTRVALTLALELKRRGGGIGAAALCGGGGQGEALVLKV